MNGKNYSVWVSYTYGRSESQIAQNLSLNDARDLACAYANELHKGVRSVCVYLDNALKARYVAI